ncbi:competence/damage-inducible protein A [Clostridium paraputrificum]|uniref:competence/damage-inducible protein A n=1 Tax=Clostridium paraputrificum TaxID=29363 RepID=UPI003D33603B
MKAEIIAVGTEILLGDIVNTNAQFLSKELASIGISVYRQEVIGDNEDRLLCALEEALNRSDIVITTGGIGPTGDDLTKETACKFFDMKLERHEESYKVLKEYFDRLNKEITESNLKQVYFPKEAKVLSNPNGTAPGAILEKDNKMIIILPGPPREMKPMFTNHVRGYLMTKGNGVIKSKVLRVLGIGESYAAEKLKDIIENGTNPTIAPYAKEEDVIFRVTAKADNDEDALALIEPIAKKVKEELGLDYYGEGEETNIQEVVGNLLVKKGLKIATAESCTGGMIASRLVSFPGISEVFLEGAVTYSNEAKIRTLKVKSETLDIFGAVSEETAKEMAIGIAKRTGADISVVTTGIAGPGGGTDNKPVGLVYIGLYYKGDVRAWRYVFNGDRNNVRTRATITALDTVRRAILLDR